MNRKILALDLALVALAGAFAWQIRVRWVEGQARERAIFINAAHARAILPPPPLTALKTVTPIEYIDVAQKMLFAKDRNPNVPIEPPPPPPPKPKMPALPFYYGQMTLGDPVVLLAESGEEQRGYRVGEKIGPFQVLAFDQERIAFEWNGERVERKLADIEAKDDAPPVQPAIAQRPAAPAARPGASNSGPNIKTIDSDSPGPSGSDDKGPLGNSVGGGFFACKPGDTTPNGAVVNGYKKIVSRGMFGEICHWEQVQ